MKSYKARFVVNISELGEDDPFMLNVRLFTFGTQRAFSVHALSLYLKDEIMNIDQKF